jgi:hypothetical protein
MSTGAAMSSWLLVLILVPGPVPNPNVEVISQHKTRQECVKAQHNKKNYMCLPKDYN